MINCEVFSHFRNPKRLIYTGAQQNILAHSLGLFYFSKVMRRFVLLCVSQLFSACTGDVVFTLGHADAQPCTMYNCFFVRLAATIMHGPLKYCLHDVARKRVGSEFRAERRKAPGACVCYCLL